MEEIVFEIGNQKLSIKKMNDHRIKLTIGHEDDNENKSFYMSPTGLFTCIKRFSNGFTDENGNSLNL